MDINLILAAIVAFVLFGGFFIYFVDPFSLFQPNQETSSKSSSDESSSKKEDKKLKDKKDKANKKSVKKRDDQQVKNENRSPKNEQQDKQPSKKVFGVHGGMYN